MSGLDWIDEIVVGLIDTYETNDPYELCDLLGISVNTVNADSSFLLCNNSLYIRDYFNQEAIFIKNDLNEHHKEFYLRHELGHALLHTNVFNSGLCNLGKLERQANYFAMWLSNVDFDEVELSQMTLEQVSCTLEIPLQVLKQITP